MPKSDFSFSAGLVTWRKACGLKQQTLAGLLGVTQTAVSFWESGKDTPSAGIRSRLSDMMAPNSRMRQAIDFLPLAEQSTLRAFYDIDGIKLVAASLGLRQAWPDFSDLSGLRLMDRLVDEAALLMHDDGFLRAVRRGEVVAVSAVSDQHVSVAEDRRFRHRWMAGFRTYGPRMLIEMTYEPASLETTPGLKRVVRFEDLEL